MVSSLHMQWMNHRLKKTITYSYNLYFKEQKQRVSTGISDKAREHTPINAARIVSANILTKLGDALANPKTVITWIMTSAGVSVGLISLIVPIRESGSMIFHTVIASVIQSYQFRKGVWILGSVLQGLSVIAMGIATMWYTGSSFGIVMVGLLTLFSLARGLCSVSAKDVLGKTVPKTRRGRINALSSSLSGILVFIVGGFLIQGSDRYSNETLGILLVCAGTLWFLASFVYRGIKEFPGEISNNKHVLKESIHKLMMIGSDKVLRRFIIARSLLLCSALITPFFLTLGQRDLGTNISLLGAFVVINGIGTFIGGPLWGSLADTNSSKLMAIGGILSASIGFSSLVVPSLTFIQSHTLWYYLIGFLILIISHEAVRLGRKTYVVDIAQGNKRSTYVAVSNTAIAIILLIIGVATALISSISLPLVIIVLSSMGILGGYMSMQLKKA